MVFQSYLGDVGNGQSVNSAAVIKSPPPLVPPPQTQTQTQYHEEGHGAASVDGSIFDVGLISQVIRRLNGNLHPLDGQEGRQVGCVGGDDDEGEGPPVGRQGGRRGGVRSNWKQKKQDRLKM